MARRAFVVLAPLITATLLLGAMELAMRTSEWVEAARKPAPISTFNPASLFVPHPYVTYAANPDHPDHNSQGFRADARRNYEAGASAVTIACMGGSSTYGTRVRRQDSYPDQLEGLLNQPEGVRVNVINAGLAGYSTANIIGLLALRIVDLKPDVVLFYVGFNDAWNRLNYSGFRSDYSHAQKAWAMPEFPIWRQSRVLDWVASRMGSVVQRDPHVHTVAWLPESGDPAQNLRRSSGEVFRRNLATLVGIARSHGAIPVLAPELTDFQGHPLESHNGEWMQAMEEHTQIVLEVAARMSVHLLDGRSAISNKSDYFADVVHFNEEGSRRFAELLAGYLRDSGLLKKERSM